ncbi:MAG TPA: Asp23/Gls24 family envelope stress response protein [Candidatus Limnocylindrales bacterium]
MTEPTTPLLRVGRGVIAEVARLAALEVPDVLRIGRAAPPWRVLLAGSPIHVRVRHGEVSIRLWLVARPGADLVAATASVRHAVATAIERLLGLRVAGVTVVVDGVGS